ncbi:response regulator [soil metagenome]
MESSQDPATSSAPPASANVASQTGSDPARGARILIVDDDPGIRDVVAEFLGRHGYAIDTASDSRTMEQALARGPVDLIVLDVMLPGEDGLAICRRLSANQDGPAIIMLSAMGEETDRIVGLELGADDYLPKPCNPRELLARVRAVLRRRQEPRAVDDGMGAACEFAGWRLDLVRRELRSPQSVVVNLSSGEFSLLRAFVERPQRVLTRDQLLDLARGRESDAYDRAIDVQISRLRRKLDDGGGGELIRTIRSEGYMFTSKVTRTP